MSRWIFAWVCLLGLTQIGWGQIGNSGFVHNKQTQGIPGYLDPRTGTFTSKVESGKLQNPDSPEVSVTEFAGTWTFKFTITVSSAMPSGSEIFCTASIDEFGDPNGNYNESAVSAATVSKGTGTCTVSIPYAWFLSNQPSDQVDASYEIVLIQGLTVGSASTATPIRDSSHDIGTFSVPANGAATTTTITARI